ncbi:MAG TPA: type 2 isopentenyl-diphosphate Delta-isomerase [Anaerolineae bacterium]|nr:type 2 isopentenyl-diphosphate Delta-isomerase [Anaerolineae bacterium]
MSETTVVGSEAIQQRKIDHLKIALSDIVQVGDAGFGQYRLLHNALPEIDFDSIDMSTTFLGKKVNYPFFISCMTGGVGQGRKINRNLAKAAQKYGIAMGVGSQRAAIQYPELEDLFMAREVAPDIPLLANVGIVQLNYGFDVAEYQQIVDMIAADALVVHINPLQEIVQPEGDRDWSGLLPKLAKVVEKLSVPVIGKEVGFGLSDDVARRLHEVGVKIWDTAGWGGTNWSLVEGLRGKADQHIGELFSEWGIPTTESIKMCRGVADELGDGEVVILGSGGVKSGVDVAKGIALGADLVGLATPFGRAAVESSEAVEALIERLGLELRIGMFGVGAGNIEALRQARFLGIG